MRCMENELQTSSGPICTLSLGLAGAAVSGTGNVGGAVSLMVLLRVCEFRPTLCPVSRVAAHECGLNAVLDPGSQFFRPFINGLIRDPNRASGICGAAQFANGVGLFHYAIEP